MLVGKRNWVGGGLRAGGEGLVVCEGKINKRRCNNMSSIDDMENRVAELEAKLEALSSTATDLNVVWVVISSVLVFFMQVGFAMVSVLF